jgi:hypothetical protein
LLRRRTDSVPHGSEFQLKTFRFVKCAASVLAAIAVTISVLDLTNVAIVDAATKIIDEKYQSVADFPQRLRSEADRMSNAAWHSITDMTVVQETPIPFSTFVPVKLASADTNALDTVLAAPAPKLDLQHARLQSPAALLNLSGQSLARAKHCLARAIYFEARAEPVRGQIAVAQVVINRVFSGFYPNDLCDVVYQNASRHLDCQFTFACDGRSKVIHERGAWARAEQIAGQVLAGDLYDPAVGSSTHYHALYVRPDWVLEMKKLARYGTHNFYRPVAWGNGADAPVWGIVPLPPNKGKAE